ncbi:MAG: hypothetical protein LBP25_01550 [Tannerellaceae bacterium]|nr:hypothetical protein [Tannerellaceae bacterium]
MGEAHPVAWGKPPRGLAPSYRITVTPYFYGCTGTPATYTITVSSCSAPVCPYPHSGVVGQ